MRNIPNTDYTDDTDDNGYKSSLLYINQMFLNSAAKLLLSNLSPNLSADVSCGINLFLDVIGLDAGKIMSIIHLETNGFSANYSHQYKMGDSQLILIV